MRRALEICTALTAVAVVGAFAAHGSSPSWVVVLAFGVTVGVAENLSVLIHRSTSVSPQFMLTMASIPVFGDHPSTVVGAALVGACAGIYLPHIRAKKVGLVVMNCGQFALSSAAAAL